MCIYIKSNLIAGRYIRDRECERERQRDRETERIADAVSLGIIVMYQLSNKEDVKKLPFEMLSPAKNLRKKYKKLKENSKYGTYYL